MEASDIVDLLIAAYKDKVQKEVWEETRKSFNALLSADADARRSKTSVDILRMNKLRIALTRFEMQYARIKEKCGDIPEVNEYMADIRAEIKALSMKKNHKCS